MHSQNAQMRKRVSQYMRPSPCPLCQGKRLRRAALDVTFAGRDIGELSRLSLQALAEVFRQVAAPGYLEQHDDNLTLEKRLAAQRIANELLERIGPLLDLGLGYLALERSTPTLSSGELQRLRLATQLNSQLFGVIYVLDEPSAGLHPGLPVQCIGPDHAHATPGPRLAEARRHLPQQPEQPQCRIPAGLLYRRYRYLRLGQVEPGQPGPAGAGGYAPGPGRPAQRARRAEPGR